MQLGVPVEPLEATVAARASVHPRLTNRFVEQQQRLFQPQLAAGDALVVDADPAVSPGTLRPSSAAGLRSSSPTLGPCDSRSFIPRSVLRSRSATAPHISHRAPLSASLSSSRASLSGVSPGWKRPGSASATARLGATVVDLSKSTTVMTELIDDLGLVPEKDLNVATKNQHAVWPATSSQSDRSAKSKLLQDMELKLSASRSSKDDPVDQQWKPYEEAFRVFIGCAAEYKPVLSSILGKVAEILHDYRSLQGSLSEQTRINERLKAEHADALDKVKTQSKAKVNGLETERQRVQEEKDKVEANLQQLLNQVYDQKVGYEEIGQKLEREVEQRRKLKLAVVLKDESALALKDSNRRLQWEMNGLKQTVDANTDLWRELTQVRRQDEANQKRHDQEQQAQRALLEEEKVKHECTQQLVRNLRRVCRRQAEEVEKMGVLCASWEAKWREVVEHRGVLLKSHTPRPSWPDLRTKYVGALGKIDVHGQRSAGVLTDLVKFADDTHSKYQRTLKRLTGCEKLLDYLEPQDFQEASKPETVYPPPGKLLVGRGTHDRVPIFLRWHGPLKNVKISKSALDKILDEIWAERREHLQEAKVAKPFPEFFAVALHARQAQPAAMAELAYNIVYALQTLQADPLCDLQLRILLGEMTEEAYLSFAKSLVGLRHAFSQLEQSLPQKKGSKPGTLSKGMVNGVLAKYFPQKSEPELVRLRSAITKDMITLLNRRRQIRENTDEIEYDALFPTDKSAERGLEFIQILRDQHVTTMDEMRVDITEALHHARDPDNTVTPRVMDGCLRFVDPGLASPTIEGIVAHCWGVSAPLPEEQEDWQEARKDVSDVARALKGVLLLRVSKRPARADASKGINKFLQKLFAKDDGDTETSRTSASGTEPSPKGPTAGPTSTPQPIPNSQAQLPALSLVRKPTAPPQPPDPT